MSRTSGLEYIFIDDDCKHGANDDDNGDDDNGDTDGNDDHDDEPPVVPILHTNHDDHLITGPPPSVITITPTGTSPSPSLALPLGKTVMQPDQTI